MTLNHNLTDTVECHLWPKEPLRCRNISIVLQTFSSLSLIGCFAIAGLIIILKKYRTTTERLVLWLSVSGFFRSLVFSLPHPKKSQVIYCSVKGFFDQYFISTHLLWVLMITVNCLLIVKRKAYQQYYKWYHVLVWTGSMIWSMIPFFSHSYGDAGIWCWIKPDTGLRFAMWYIPLFVLGFLMILIHAYLLWFLIKFQKPLNNRSDDERTAHIRMRKDINRYWHIHSFISCAIYRFSYSK